MKRIFFIAVVVVTSVIILVLNFTKSSAPISNASAGAPSKAKRVPNKVVPSASLTPPPEASPTMAAADFREQWLTTLYESPSVANRLLAARQLAARGDEAAFLDLATFITAAEVTGDDSLVDLAQEVAGILGQMQGAELQPIATELAYSPSALVSEAAVNASVKAQPVQAPQQLGPTTGYRPADQAALDGYAQQLLQAEMQTLSAPISAKQ